MTAILRNNAATVTSQGVGKAELKGGGDGRTLPAGIMPQKVKPKVRYSHDPAAELMPAAEFLGHEPDFAAILEDFRDSPFNPARRKILGRLMGVFAMDYQGAGPAERAFLRRLLLARNAREGYAANRALHLCGVPHAIRRTLALGVAESRFATGPLMGFLGAVQARVAATTMILLGPAGREMVWNLLTRAGVEDGSPLPGADRVIERALILKALAAQRHRLGPWSPAGEEVLLDLDRFAAEIRGCNRETLAARTTLYPGDETRVAPNLERYEGGARAPYLARGDIDPVFAWREHGAAREISLSAPIDNPDAALTLPDLDRSPVGERPRLHQFLAEARAGGARVMPPTEREALADYLAGRELSETRKPYLEQGLTRMREAGWDVVRPNALESIRQDARGVYKFDAEKGLGLLLCRYTGAVYIRRVVSDQRTAGLDPVLSIVHALRKGLAVPLTVKEQRLPVVRAWAALAERQMFGEQIFDLRYPSNNEDVELRAVELMGRLPDNFGQQARVETYLAPAALDLLAPPFGIPFPELGIEDAL